MRCSWAALLATAAMHVGMFVLLPGGPSPDTRRRMNGIPLPPVVMQVMIRPPDAPAPRQVAAPSTPVVPALPPPPPTALRLLTPPPVPIEIIGAATPAPAPERGVVEPVYFPTSKLTVAPRPTAPPQVHLPKDWLEAFGQSVLTLYVNASGTVDAVTLRRTNLPPELHDSVLEAFRNLLFVPGEIDGLAVPSVLTIEADISAPISRRR